MTKKELEDRLKAEKVDPNCYSLDGYWKDDAFFLEQQADGWHVYFSERGQRWDEQVFPSEDLACRFLFKWILEDPSTRRQPPPHTGTS